LVFCFGSRRQYRIDDRAWAAPVDSARHPNVTAGIHPNLMIAASAVPGSISLHARHCANSDGGASLRRAGGRHAHRSVRARTVVALLFPFTVVNFADQAVIGIAAVPIMRDLQLAPRRFGRVGSSFFLLGLGLAQRSIGLSGALPAANSAVAMLAAGWDSQRLLARRTSSRDYGRVSVAIGGAALAIMPYLPGSLRRSR
jgi:hypothetical protein